MLSAILAPLAANAQATTVEGTFGAWSLYANESADPKLCFAAATPSEKKPATANRGPTLLYVSAWPKDGIRSEVSVKLGYPVKPDSTVTVAVGTDTFSAVPERGARLRRRCHARIEARRSTEKGI